MRENRFGHLRLVDATGILIPFVDKAAAERGKLEELGFVLAEITPEMARELLREVTRTDEVAATPMPAVRLAHVTTSPLPDRPDGKVPPVLRLIVGDGYFG